MKGKIQQVKKRFFNLSVNHKIIFTQVLIVFSTVVIFVIINHFSFIDFILKSNENFKQKNELLFSHELLLALIVFLLSLLPVFYLSRLLNIIVNDPVKELLKSIKHVNDKKDFTKPVYYSSEDEIGVLADEFNSLLLQLKIRDREIKKSHEELEQKVRERTLQFQKSNRSLKEQSLELAREKKKTEIANLDLTEAIKQYEDINVELANMFADMDQANHDLKNTQEQLIQSEKMASLGQLIAGVAHEINSPMGAIKSSNETVVLSLKQTLENLPRVFQVLNKEETKLFFKMLDHSISNTKVISLSEKRNLKKYATEALDKMNIENTRYYSTVLINAGIINNFENYTVLLKHEQSDLIINIFNLLSNSIRGTNTIKTAVGTISKVIYALKSFSRFDKNSKQVKASIIETIETVLTLYQNKIKHKVELFRNYEDIPEILCYPDELNQVWTNLIQNSLQAMDYRGVLKIAVKKNNSYIEICINDSGEGIPENIKHKIFNPFFTTKNKGEGSGLGLDIVKRIVDKHRGKISIETKVNEGTSFTILLPYQQGVY